MSKLFSHELNFFIFKRDKQFFESHVKMLIQNKIEKTFIDWYLLADYDQQYSQKILRFNDSITEANELNTFE